MPHHPLDSRQLRAFVLLAETQSFTQAAKELNLTQSAVSHAIKSLENDIGCTLIDRIGKKAALTEAGRKLFTSAQNILTEMINIRHELHKTNRWGQSTLRIGATTSVCQYLLPSVLREFKESFPSCTVNIVPGDTPEVLESLQYNKIDIAIALQPFDSNNTVFRPLFKDELKLIAPPLHPWNTDQKIRPDQIAREHFILYNKRSYTYRLIENYFRQQDIELTSTLELGSMEAIKELVKVGMGISIGADWVITQELQEGSLITLPLGKKKLVRNWGIMHRKGRRQSITEETLIGLCELASENLIMKH